MLSSAHDGSEMDGAEDLDGVSDGFLIGVLLNGPAEAVAHRVYARLELEGFGNLRRAQADVFRFIPPEGGRVTDVAAAAGMSKQAMAYVVEGLIELGYLSRAPDPDDGRAQIVRRTERGWEVNRAARRAVMEVQAEWTVALGPERMELLLGLLRDLGDYLGIVYQGSIPEVSIRHHAARP